MLKNQLSKICCLSQSQVKNYVTNKLKKCGYEPIVADGYVYAKGTYPVLLAAHMDTVHKTQCTDIVFSGENDNIMSSPVGIGGDDRCGIFLILNIIREIKCSVVFLEDEEIGCIGAKKFGDAYKGDKLGNNYIVEFDRRGNNDCVFYDLDNEEFEKFCESTGYFKTKWGSCSDISYIAPALGLAAVNFSSGYYNEHTLKETINFAEVLTIYEKAKEIILKEVEKPFEWKEKKYNYPSNGYYGYGYGYGYDYDDYCYDDYSYYYGRYSKKKRRIVKETLYHIYVVDEQDEFVTYEVNAVSKQEAIGKLFMTYTFLSYSHVINIFEARE